MIDRSLSKIRKVPEKTKEEGQQAVVPALPDLEEVSKLVAPPKFQIKKKPTKQDDEYVVPEQRLNMHQLKEKSPRDQHIKETTSADARCQKNILDIIESGHAPDSTQPSALNATITSAKTLGDALANP